jgi:hypothetical protein
LKLEKRRGGGGGGVTAGHENKGTVGGERENSNGWLREQEDWKQLEGERD